MHKKRKLYGIALIIMIALAACRPIDESLEGDENSRLKIVVTTTFIGDVVRQIAGEIAQVTVLLAPGQNPHSYQPAPQDMVKISQADIIFVNGLDLEGFLPVLLDGSSTEAELVVVSDGIQLQEIPDQVDSDLADHEDEEDHGRENGIDPHVWFNPNNLIVWSENIIRALSDLDPEHASDFLTNGEAYQEELIALDKWIREEINRIPESNRKLVTDHISLRYFAEEYGFTQIGAVIPALTTEAETSGQELAGLIDTIRDNQVKAIFVGIDFDPTLSRRVSEETGVDLIQIYFGSLTDGGPAGSYLDFMRYDVKAIVSGLD